MRTTKLNVKISAEVKARIAADAEEREVSFNDVGVAILAAYFGVRFDGTGRRSNGTHTLDGTVVFARVPEKLDEKITLAARRRPTGSKKKQDVVEQVFREHYQLDAVPA